MRNPQFKNEYLQARREGLAQATARLQQSSGPAASTLLKLMVDPAMPPAIRLRAADYVLKHSLKSLEDDDLEARLAQLEDADKTQGRRSGVTITHPDRVISEAGHVTKGQLAEYYAGVAALIHGEVLRGPRRRRDIISRLCGDNREGRC
jgi:hypothetical protein